MTELRVEPKFLGVLRSALDILFQTRYKTFREYRECIVRRDSLGGLDPPVGD